MNLNHLNVTLKVSQQSCLEQEELSGHMSQKTKKMGIQKIFHMATALNMSFLDSRTLRKNKLM